MINLIISIFINLNTSFIKLIKNKIMRFNRKIPLPYRKMKREGFCFSNGVSLIDRMNAPDLALSSRHTSLKNYRIKKGEGGSIYKRGVKFVFEEQPPYFRLCVEAGGGADLYGICVDIDDSETNAVVMPLWGGNTFQGFLLVNDSEIKMGDKLLFNKYGILEKVKNNAKSKRSISYNGIALTDSFFDKEQGHYLAQVSVY
ncbi:DUF228 domain-containing protein (plasmid) [Borrelia miyamotoi]|nr:DUF228 domain-containing protein [Borrelia miyamotoi]